MDIIDLIPTTPGQLLIEGLIVGFVVIIVRKVKEKYKKKHSIQLTEVKTK